MSQKFMEFSGISKLLDLCIVLTQLSVRMLSGKAYVRVHYESIFLYNLHWNLLYLI